ncbi:hypothetical protein LZK74_07305 [Sinorhizobium meliloti]|nr:hypothetical protein LZK74_07305 [Sinorhizobium meliloti]
MGDDPVKIIAGGAASNHDRKLERLCGPRFRKDVGNEEARTAKKLTINSALPYPPAFRPKPAPRSITVGDMLPMRYRILSSTGGLIPPPALGAPFPSLHILKYSN